MSDGARRLVAELAAAGPGALLVVEPGEPVDAVEAHVTAGGRAAVLIAAGAPEPAFDGLPDTLLIRASGRGEGVLLLGVPAAEAARASGRAALAQTGRVAALEEANAMLRVANERLAADRTGRAGSAAARRTLELEDRLAEVSALLEQAKASARHNDWLYQTERARLASPRYVAVDRLHERIAAVPGLRRALAAVWRLAGRRRR